MAKVIITRFDPEKDKAPHGEAFDFELTGGMTALDVLNGLFISDPTLTFSYCCRSGHCGICGAMIDGVPALLCRTPARDGMTIGPLGCFTVLKDLAVDREAFEAEKKALRLFLERKTPYDAENGAPEKLPPESYAACNTASRCIECCCCMAACPIYEAKRHDFAGPAAFTLLARHFADPRDEMSRALMARSMGITLCIACGKCTKICPQEADPAGMIAMMLKAIS